ncbi:MAG: hypothetical protein ACI4OS_02085 [Akkermansia sp.]
MSDLPQAPEYTLAEQLIASMRQDAALAPYVYQTPWDREEQHQALAMAAGQYSGTVAVAPQLPAPNTDDPDGTAGTLRARLAVAILCTQQVPGGRTGRRVAGLLYKVINALLRWDVTACGIPYALPKIDSINTLDMSELPKLANLQGVLINASIVYNYKRHIK